MSWRRALVWLPSVALMVAIAWGSHQSEWPEAAQGFPDWLLHGSGFGALAGTTFWALAYERHVATWRIALAAIAIASAYGVVDESHQSWIVGRDASVRDWLVDTAGAAIVAGIAAAWRGR